MVKADCALVKCELTEKMAMQEDPLVHASIDTGSGSHANIALEI